MDEAQRWRKIASYLAKALETDDDAQWVRALAVYRSAAWREDMDAVPTTDAPETTGRRWRADVRLAFWDNTAAEHAAARGVIVSAKESPNEIVVTCIWVTDDVGIGAAMFELIERMRPVLDIHVVDFASLEQAAD